MLECVVVIVVVVVDLLCFVPIEQWSYATVICV